MTSFLLMFLFLGAGPATPPAPAQPQPAAKPDSCVTCHAALDDKLGAPAKAFTAGDVHQKAGFSCVDCHGGDRTSDDMGVAMNKGHGFIGKVKRTAVPDVCAKCHSDANLMQKFKPQQRVDQLTEYKTSTHGKLLAKGDESVATCIDCHGAHGVHEVKDSQSPVYPLHLPQTCAACHANAEHMAKYKIPTSQFKDYQTSVHWDAVSKRMDLSAPTCASCHGNHGAKPPAAASTAAVCGGCHALVEQLYKGSPHQPVFASMGLAGCVTCHQNHAVKRPDDNFLGGEEAVCAACHDASSAGGKTSAAMYKGIHDLDDSLNRAEAILTKARVAGMEVSEPMVQLQDGKDRLIKARVAIHNFNAEKVRGPVDEGMKIAEASYKAGEEAMAEQKFRRSGLAVSLIAILLTIGGLFLAIRALEKKAEQ